jgi:hypothetical protein
MSQNPKIYVAQAFIRAENCKKKRARKRGEERRGAIFAIVSERETQIVPRCKRSLARNPTTTTITATPRGTRWRLLQCQPTVFQNDPPTCGNGPENRILYCGGIHDGKQEP